MRTYYTIGQLAREAGVPISTLRYYERVGLLRPDDRSEGNYRLYGNEAVERLRFVRTAQATGFTIEDIKALVSHRHDEPGLCQDVQGLIRERLADVKRRMDDLRHVRQVLNLALKKCVHSEKTGHCEVVESITADAHGTPRKPSRRSGKNIS